MTKRADEEKDGMPPIAIVGLGALFSGAPGVQGFWSDVVSGRDNIVDVPETHWRIADYYDPDPNAPDKTYCKRGGFISPVAFDPMAFGIPPAALPSTDTTQLLALVVAKQALDEARKMATAAIDPDRISVVLGVASATELTVQMGARLQRPHWEAGLRASGVPEDEIGAICERIAGMYTPWQESSFPGLLGNVVAGRIANRLDLGGTNYVTDAACASSLSALQVALHELYLGESDMVLTGGADALNDILMFMCFSKTPAFSPTGDCRPFSDKADGTIIGEGFGFLALRRLEDAERDGQPIYAVIRGLGSSSDGRASSVYAPRPEGQAKALARAYARAGYSPASVDLVEAHGTATKAGDVAEFKGLMQVFAPAAPDKHQWCALGSVKSQIGHTKAAAGSASLIKAALALHHKILPPTLKVERPNPQLKIDESPFYLNTAARPWIKAEDTPRRASVSSFGFGGSNFHVTLEEYRGAGPRPARMRTWPSELVALGASDAKAMLSLLDGLDTDLAKGHALATLAETCNAAFDAGATLRLGFVAADAAELTRHIAKARAALQGGGLSTLNDPDILAGEGAAQSGRTAFLFPGQGSQYVNMGADLAMAFAEACGVFDRAAALPAFADAPLHETVFPKPVFTPEARAVQDKVLTAMANAQPAIGAVSMMQLRLLARMGLKADAFGGHSFGELSALSAAGAFDEAALLSAARMRGLLMTEAAKADGAMLAIAAEAEKVAGLIARAADLVIANDNSPQQTVIAGPTAAIAAIESVLKDAGLTIFRLPVATAFHSPIVAPAAQPFARYLDETRMGAPSAAVYANATAAIYPRTAKAARALLAEQIESPVRFRGMIEAMYADGVRRFVEVGPGRVLTGLTEQVLKGRPHEAVALDDKKAQGLRGWWRGLARLCANGVKLDLAALAEGTAAPAPPAPKPAHAVMISGANYGKPFPPKPGTLPPPRVAKTAPPVAAPIPSLPPTPTVAPLRMNPPPPFAPAVVAPVPMPSAATAAPQSRAVEPGSQAAILKFHEETLAAHRHYQDLMAESHRAFLTLAAEAVAALSGGSAPRLPIDAVSPRVAPPPVPLPVVEATSQPVAPTPVSAPPRAPEHSQPAPAAIAQLATASPAADPVQAVLAIVAEKTGYPADMLDLSMEMEAGLGIDSIKQVEILSALQDKFPGLPEIDPSELATLKTLQHVVDRLKATMPAASAPLVSPAAPRPETAIHPAPSDPSAVVLAIVAEKTGYPADMLEPSMEMEAGLGIDSIKQVEILSAVQDKFPGLPEIDPSELASLRTLGDVIARVRAALGGVAVAPSDSVPDAPAVAAPSQAPAAAPALLRAVPVLAEAPPLGLSQHALRFNPTVYVTDEAPDVARALVTSLTQRGIRARAVGTPPAQASAIISLSGLASRIGPDNALDVHLRAFRAAKTVAAESDPAKRLFVIVQATGGSFGLDGDPGMAAWGGGLSALAKTAAQEWPGGSVKAIDIADPRDAARLIADELLLGGPEVEVGFDAQGVRRTVRLERQAEPGGSRPPLPRGSVVIVSGGARGVTADCAAALAERDGLSLALLGRTALAELPSGIAPTGDATKMLSALSARAKETGATPDLSQLRAEAAQLAAACEARETLAMFAARGITAHYVRADITDAAAVGAALKDVRQSLGPISGFVHGAGVLADKRIGDLTEGQFARVFTTKVQGLAALLEATRGDALKLVALFSSIAARMGNAGQAAYAAANEVLNKVAAAERARRGASARVVAFDWGPWDGGMVDPALKAHFVRAGVGLIARAAGATAFAHEAAHDGPSELVIAADAGDPLRAFSLDLSLDLTRMPYLRDHQVKGRIVLPVAIMLDRLMRLGRAMTGEAHAEVRVKDFQVLSGVTFAADDPMPILTLSVQPRRDNGTGILDVTVADGAGKPRYRARIDITTYAMRDAPRPTVNGGLHAWSLTPGAAYAGPLFHGPKFAAITQLEGLSDEGGVALMRRAGALDWPDEAWSFDPAAMDGGLQLGLLWSAERHGPPLLPQRVGEFVLRDMPPSNAPLRCAFRAREKGAGRADFDFVYALEDGTVVAEIRDAEFYAISGT